MTKNARGQWLLRKKEVTVTTWRFRVLLLVGIAAAFYATYPGWLVAIASSLVHDQTLEPAERVLIENFDTDYRVFEAAAGVLRSGYSGAALVPVVVDEQAVKQTSVETGFVEVMSRVAGIDDYETVPVRHIEPISLNVAGQVADYLEEKGIRSIIVVSPRLRSTRSCLVYDHILTPRGIRVQCVAASSSVGVNNWWNTWHGMQDVWLEYSKLLYYRLWVL